MTFTAIIVFLCKYALKPLFYMKDFVKYTLATLCGLLLAGIATFILTIIFLAGLMTAENHTPAIQPHSILRLTLHGELREDVTEAPLSTLLGESMPVLGLRNILTAVYEAKENPDIQGIYIEAKTLTGASPAMLQEIRETLIDFKESGKPIIAYSDNYTQGCYYICSVADQIILNPQGQLTWQGMASQPIFYTDLLEKAGVKMQVFKVGNYKSAVEPFTENGMSEANREQVSSYLHDIWETMLSEVSLSRTIAPKLLNTYADQMLTFQPAEYTVEIGMTDTLCYIDGVTRILQAMSGRPNSTPRMVDVKELAATATNRPQDIRDQIVVYQAYGDIVEHKTEWSENVIDAETTCLNLKKLREDSHVKAVVLRLNTGGGSAYASEQIWHEVKLLNQTKPVVVSMGGMAASGGYYIACAAHHIVAEPTTLTGSIGIFGMIPDASELLREKLGLHFDVVKTNKHADFGTPARPFNAQEANMMQTYIERGYSLFTQRVSEGRNLTPTQVSALAEGRVWTGKQAVENGLADCNGNLQTAIQEAAILAGLTDYTISYAPTPSPWYENLLEKNKKDYISSELRQVLGNYYTPLMNLQLIRQTDGVLARLPFELNLIH